MVRMMHHDDDRGDVHVQCAAQLRSYVENTVTQAALLLEPHTPPELTSVRRVITRVASSLRLSLINE